MPASNARAIEKSRTLDVDVVILDLEDAVAPDLKVEARKRAVQAAASGGFANRELVIRINGFDTPWGADDLAAVARAGVDAVLLPKVSTPADLAATGGRVEAPEGSQEISIALDLERVAGGAIVPGSRVGVWGSTGGTTGLLFDQVLVTTLASTVSADDGEQSTQGTVLVTFAVTADQAQSIIQAAEFGEIWLSLQESR